MHTCGLGLELEHRAHLGLEAYGRSRDARSELRAVVVVMRKHVLVYIWVVVTVYFTGKLLVHAP